MKQDMRDIQDLPDYRKVDIDKVGVKDINYPIVVLDKKNKTQHTIATINMYVDLPHRFKGTHMSRFIEILNEHRREITIRKIPVILEKMKERLKANSAHLEVDFPYFIEREAPVSKAKSLMEYRCKYSGTITDKKDFVMEVKVPVTTLCPCSKEISERGAHNQRGLVVVSLRTRKFLWIEDLIELIEECASSPVYALLKRSDERFVTEMAYNHPMFVEDVVRDIALKLGKKEEVTWFSVEAENCESIHNHSAYAYLESKGTD
ncbi:MAG: GTP cyclohydrolase FolE2 [Thermodesulfobacteriota bacterium]